VRGEFSPSRGFEGVSVIREETRQQLMRRRCYTQVCVGPIILCRDKKALGCSQHSTRLFRHIKLQVPVQGTGIKKWYVALLLVMSLKKWHT